MRWIGTAFLVIGAMMLLVAAALFAAEWQFLAHASHTTGTVIELVEHRSSKGSRSWAPRVIFRDERGAQRIFEGSVASVRAANRIGDTVPVVYDATNADVDSTVSKWLKVWISTGAGLVFAAVGYVSRRT
ncbi:MAG TPA: DUF3592 domain-containing protein [Thermoanaerobaculia bacterium]|nr:DUF3592 domain-containing protein [Thermoanaerobaculia bacterium]